LRLSYIYYTIPLEFDLINSSKTENSKIASLIFLFPSPNIVTIAGSLLFLIASVVAFAHTS